MLQQNPRDVSALTGDHAGKIFDRLDVLLGKLGMGLGTDGALEIPVLMDQVSAYLDKADPESQGGKIIAAQFETACRTLRKNMQVYLREIGDPQKLDIARQAAGDTADAWWWQPEKMIADDRRASMKKTLRWGGIGLGILLVFIIVYQVFLQPDPQVIAALDARNEAELILDQGGDKVAALARIEQGLMEAPGDAELLVIKDCLLTLIGNRDIEAAAAFDAAVKAAGSRETALLMRSQYYIVLMDAARARADAETIIAENPKSARAYLLLGQALEDQKDPNGAIDAYETASSLGIESDDPTVTAEARVKLGMVMQSMDLVFPTVDLPTPTATP